MTVSYTHLDVYKRQALRRAAAKKLRTDVQTLKKLALVKRSVDARKKQDVRFVVTVDAVSYTHLDVYKRQFERWGKYAHDQYIRRHRRR